MKILDKLEWNKITEEVNTLALTELGKEFCIEMPLYTDIAKIQKELDLTDEAVRLSNSMLLPPINSINNIGEILKEAQVSRMLSEEEILETIKCIRISRLLKGFFIRNEDVAQELAQISINLFEDKSFEDEISEMFSDNGKLRSDASAELKSLNASLKDNSQNLKNMVSKTLMTLEKYLQEPIFTTRDGRYVFQSKLIIRHMYKV